MSLNKTRSPVIGAATRQKLKPGESYVCVMCGQPCGTHCYNVKHPDNPDAKLRFCSTGCTFGWAHKRVVRNNPARKNPRRVVEMAESERTGERGFIPVGAPRDFEPMATVAHDLIEHQPRDKGTVADELMALGVIHYIRFDAAKRSARYTDVQAADARDLASDVVRMYFDDVQRVAYESSGMGIYPVGALYTPPKAKPLDHEHGIRVECERQFTDRAGDLERAIERGEADDATEETVTALDNGWNEYLKCALAWMAFGSERARRRYGKHAPDELRSLFDALNRLSGQFAEEYPEHRGEVVVRYSLKKRCVSMHIKGIPGTKVENLF